MSEEVILGIHFIVNAPLDEVVESAHKLIKEMQTILQLEQNYDDDVDKLFERVSHISIARHIT